LDVVIHSFVCIATALILPSKSGPRRAQNHARIVGSRWPVSCHLKRFRFLNAERFGTILAVQPNAASI
jgi:hypothetical protein